jgi:hypothetical protein
MQQALQLMTLQLSEVLADVTGITGQAIMRAIWRGERDPVRLAPLRNPACKASADTIAKALTGTWRAEHVFILQQALALFACYTQQVAERDAQIERQCAAMKPHFESEVPLAPLPRTQPGSQAKNPPSYEARGLSRTPHGRGSSGSDWALGL